MQIARARHTVTLLTGNKALIAAGVSGGSFLSSCELYDLVTGVSSLAGGLNQARAGHTAIRLNNGKVLLAGGVGPGGVMQTAEVYDPAAGAFTLISMSVARVNHTATLLPDGRVLVAGGSDGVNALDLLEVFDPASNTFTLLPGRMTNSRESHTATLTLDGKVLIAGGRNGSGALATTDYVSSETLTVSAGPLLNDARFNHTATLLQHGQVDLVGGTDGTTIRTTHEIIYPVASDPVVFQASMLREPRYGHVALNLPDCNRLLVLGGRSGYGPMNTGNIIDPEVTGATWEGTSNLQTAHADAGAIAVAGRVWVFGGNDSTEAATKRVESFSYATVRSEEEDYAPNSVVTLLGAGWLPGEQVELAIFRGRAPSGVPDATFSATADAQGKIENSQFMTSSNDSGVTFCVRARGEASTTTAYGKFYDSHSISGLSVTSFTQTNSSVALTINGSNFTLPYSIYPYIKDSYGSVTYLPPSSYTASAINVTIPASIANVPGTYTVYVTQNLQAYYVNCYAYSCGFFSTCYDCYPVYYSYWHDAYAPTNLTITPGNHAPVANAQSVTTAEDTAKAITLVATDADGNPLSYSIVSGPSSGTLSGSGANRTYTPNLNFNGADSFTFKVNDGALDSNVATVAITVTAVNDAPVANDANVSTAEDTAKAITLVANDVDNGSLTYSVVSGPSHGTLGSITGDAITYTPAANYNGPDSFTFKANDGALDSNPATVAITVTSVNDGPAAKAQTVVTNEDVAASITLAGTDVDNDPLTLTFAIVTGPTHGQLSGSGASRTYTPDANYSGPDSFTFTVNDGALTSAPATVSITVVAVNDAPIALNQSVTTPEDTALPITLTGSDVDSSGLTFAVVNGPAHGALSGSAPTLTYTPDANYNGPDSFTFKVSDGTLDSATNGTVTLNVTPVNDAPVASDGGVSTPEDTAKTVTLIATDIEGASLGYSIVSGPSHGTLGAISGNTVAYTPAADYNGPDSFTFKANDGSLDSNVATVSITVTAVNDAPVATGQSVSTDEDTAKTITLAGSDIDGDILTYGVGVPAHGTLSGTAPNLTYTPALNYNGPDSFTFTVNDGTVDSAPATVSITVNAVNDAPVATAQTVITNEDIAASITLAGADVDNDPLTLTFAIVTGPAHGQLTGSGASRTYTPDVNYNGPDSFTFTVNDGALTSAPATVSITVVAVNDAPIALDQPVTLAEDTPTGITLTGSDVEGSGLTFAVVTGPAHGTLSGTAPNLTYTPALNYNGPDSFTFKVNDGTIDSATNGTVTITVTAVNDAPVAAAQSVTTAEDTGKSITLAGSDVDGDALTYSVVTGPAHGSLSGTAPNLTYTPAPNYNGPDSFTFKVNDGTVDSPSATVSLTVTPVNDAPVLAAIASKSVNEQTQLQFTLSGSDVDTGDTLTYSVSGAPAGLSVNSATGVVTWTPTEAQGGNPSSTYPVTFRVTDSGSLYHERTVDITVFEVNRPPSLVDPGSQSLSWGNPLTLALSGSDPDIPANTLTYSIQSGSLAGMTLNAGTGAFAWTPTSGQVGSHPVTFRVTDDGGLFAEQSITITVGKRATTLIYNGDASKQYSDKPLLRATLTDAATGSAIAGATIGFTIGTQSTSAVTDSSGVASTSALALTQAPASYSVASSFIGDAIYAGSSDTDSFTINTENASPVVYAGGTYFSTANSSSLIATVALSASATDDSDGARGDIRNGKLEFRRLNSDNTYTVLGDPLLPIGLVTAADPTVGTATTPSFSYTLQGSEVTNNGASLTVYTLAKGWYVGTSDPEVITITVPGTENVSGGGYLVLAHSAGQYAGDAGSHCNFGLTMKYNKSGKNLQGQTNIIIRSAGHLYQIKSNAIDSLATTGTNYPRQATIVTKANLTDITDPLNPISLGGNLSLQVQMVDNGSGGATDQVAIALSNSSGGLLFSSNWTGTKTDVQTLGGGNLSVR